MQLAAPCTDCPRGCASRGRRSFCGTSRPGRIHWRGVTYLEEHEIAPTYEVYFTGCSLRCRFCTVPAAIYRPDEGEWLAPEALAEQIAGPEVPPFRSVSLVGGDPIVNLPYVRPLVAALRARLPDKALVLNTNLYLDPALAPELAGAFDWVVGDVHFWRPACAGPIAGARDYPAAATAAAEALLAAGARLILRVLVLPGHVECCARPTVAWAAALRGDVLLHVMTHYAPAGRARGHATLGRPLTPEEVAAARALAPPGARLPAAAPLAGAPPRPLDAVDPPAPLEVAEGGAVLLPFVTGDLLPVAAELEPSLAGRLVYLQPPGTAAATSLSEGHERSPADAR